MWEAVIITPFINVLMAIYHFVPSFGIAIILFTILIRLITHPLTVQQLKGTSAMQDLQKDPRWLEAQKKYKDDKEKLSQEQLKLYKELGVNPFSSCLPTLIQFPIIIGLYQSIIRALGSTPIELLYLQQHVYPFMQKIYLTLMPIQNHFLWFNLSQPDNTIKPSFLPFSIPLLAVVVVVTTFLQTKLMTPPSASPGDQTAQMTKAMNLYMPLLMGWMALTLASGLSIYFITSNIIGILQYAALGRINWNSVLPKFITSRANSTDKRIVAKKADGQRIESSNARTARSNDKKTTGGKTNSGSGRAKTGNK